MHLIRSRAHRCCCTILLLSLGCGCAGDAPSIGAATPLQVDAGADLDDAPRGFGSEPSSLCLPCTSDDQCGGARDYCLPFEEGAACGTDCEQGSCPGDYECLRVRTSDGFQQQCVPLEGNCLERTRANADGGAPPANADGGQPDASAASACEVWSDWSCVAGSSLVLCRASCGAKLVSCTAQGECACSAVGTGGGGGKGAGSASCGVFVGDAPCDVCGAAVVAGCCAH